MIDATSLWEFPLFDSGQRRDFCRAIDHKRHPSFAEEDELANQPRVQSQRWFRRTEGFPEFFDAPV